MKKILLLIAIMALITTVAAWLRYGGGEPYTDLSTSPVMAESALEEVVSYRLPIGNVAVSRTGRVFFTAGRDLDRYVIWDYLNRRREIVAS